MNIEIENIISETKLTKQIFKNEILVFLNQKSIPKIIWNNIG